MSRKRWRASKQMQARARHLRGAMTPAERELWERLRSGQLGGWQFRRQHAVGSFILDFFCAKAKLVIELDGAFHADRLEYDQARTDWLNQEKRYRVVRFANDEVRNNIEGVLESISAALEDGSKPK